MASNDSLSEPGAILTDRKCRVHSTAFSVTSYAHRWLLVVHSTGCHHIEGGTLASASPCCPWRYSLACPLCRFEPLLLHLLNSQPILLPSRPYMTFCLYLSSVHQASRYALFFVSSINTSLAAFLAAPIIAVGFRPMTRLWSTSSCLCMFTSHSITLWLEPAVWVSPGMVHFMIGNFPRLNQESACIQGHLVSSSEWPSRHF